MTADRKKIIQTILAAVAIGVLGFFVFAFLLRPIFSGSFLLPQFIAIGSIHIQYYGIILGLAAASGYLLAIHRRKIYNIPIEQADTIMFISLISGFIGARLYHVISQFDYYVNHLGQIIQVWNGGLGIFGAAIGAVFAIYIYIKYFSKTPQNFLDILDWLAPSIILGQAIGRFGNFFNYELYGYPTNLPWKMFVPLQFRNSAYELVQYFHPLFLYEAMGSLVILVLLIKLKFSRGRLFLTWFLLYNLMRFFLEYLRVDSVFHAGIRINALVALGLAALAGVLILRLKNSQNDQPNI